MSDFIAKVSKYHLLNYLLPGVLFIIFAPSLYGRGLLELANENTIFSLFLGYFLGMIISRIGSVIIEPILRKVGFIKFAEYKDFISASKKDKKIETLSTDNNVYRTITSLFVVLLILHWLVPFAEEKSVESISLLIVFLIFSFILFFFSYKKQTRYIKNRIENNKNQQL